MIRRMTFRPRTCEACGRDFGCGSESGGGCWCDELTLDEATLARLRATYERCLCPACLGALAVSDAISPA